MRDYVSFNAFSHGRRSGNQLVVVADSSNLSTEDMQAIARQFACPNTIFLGPDGLSCRIFTRSRELRFSGNGMVGLAAYLGRRDGISEGELRHYTPETLDGPAQCTVTLRDLALYATFASPAIPTNLGNLPPLGMLLTATGLSVNDIRQDALSPSRYRAAHPYLYLPVKSVAALQAVKADTAFMRRMFALYSDDTPALYVFAMGEPGSGTIRARMFSPSMGLAEDAATGAAPLGLAAMLSDAGLAHEGDNTIIIEQGVEMLRPSRIDLSFTVTGGKLGHMSIGGRVVPISEGRIYA